VACLIDTYYDNGPNTSRCIGQCSCSVITQLDEPSPAWCLRLISEFSAADERAIALARGLSRQQINWKAQPPEWSVGQCLDHLRVSNEVYCRAISNSLEGRPAAVVQEITPGWFGQWFIRNYIEPSSSKRRTPEKIKPVPDVEPTILDQFLVSNRNARELVYRARNFDVNHIRFTNPFIPLIRFTVGTGLEILSKHERRHLLQAERIRKNSEFPNSRLG
jgi:hypothetical protein